MAFHSEIVTNDMWGRLAWRHSQTEPVRHPQTVGGASAANETPVPPGQIHPAGGDGGRGVRHGDCRPQPASDYGTFAIQWCNPSPTASPTNTCSGAPAGVCPRLPAPAASAPLGAACRGCEIRATARTHPQPRRLGWPPTMPLFERYVAIDWSANNAPKTGSDSIWSCVGSCAPGDVLATNHATRRSAESWLVDTLVAAVAAGDRVLVGMDFPYGYPAGFAAALGLDGDPWRATWRYLTRLVIDDSRNRSNRFEVASDINLRLGDLAPFWGRPQHQQIPHLPSRKEVNYKDAHHIGGVAEWRHVEQLLRQRGAQPQPAWKLAYTGSVGSQTLLGIPVLERLRDHVALQAVSKVWPFEALLTFPWVG